MGRPLRWLQPKTTWFVTTRCIGAKLLMRPDSETNALFGYWLARALARFPGIALKSAIATSNHLHMIVSDDQGSLSAFMCYFLANFAKDLNDLRDRTGPVFHRRFSAEPILDPGGERERLEYLVCNPVAAGLCFKHDAWPGALLWASSGKPQSHTYRIFDRDGFQAATVAAGRSGEKPNREPFWKEAKLTVHPLEDEKGNTVDPAPILKGIRQREAEIRKERAEKPVLGREKILAQNPEGAPKHPKSSPRPLCHAALELARNIYKAAYRAFADLYRAASTAFRAGSLRRRFPDWSFPPWRPLVLPDTA